MQEPIHISSSIQWHPGNISDHEGGREFRPVCALKLKSNQSTYFEIVCENGVKEDGKKDSARTSARKNLIRHHEQNHNRPQCHSLWPIMRFSRLTGISENDSVSLTALAIANATQKIHFRWSTWSLER